MSAPANKQILTLRVNGETYTIAVTPWRTLAEALREDLRLTGTKVGCGDGDCGACTVLCDGRSVLACLTLALEAEGKDIRTVEGLAKGREDPHPVQRAFVERGAIQCGFCTPGMELACVQLLARNPDPTEEEVRAALSGNLCRCTGYARIVDAILTAARSMRAPEAP